MKVSELEQWPKIYKLCEEYWDNDSVSGQWGSDDNDIMDGFVWDSTAQGVNFWYALYKGDVEEAKSLQPHLFEEEEVDSEGFIKWNGGEMPVPEGTMVHVKYKDGGESIVTAGSCDQASFKKIKGFRSASNWRITDRNYSIVAYKLYTGDGYVDGVKCKDSGKLFSWQWNKSRDAIEGVIDFNEANNTVLGFDRTDPDLDAMVDASFKGLQDIAGTISVSDSSSGAASLQEPHKPLIVESKLKYLKLGDEVLFDYRQDTPKNNYTKQPLQDAYKAWAFSEPFGVPWLDGERKQLQEFKLNTRKALNKLAVQGLVSGDMIAKFDELLKGI